MGRWAPADTAAILSQQARGREATGLLWPDPSQPDAPVHGVEWVGEEPGNAVDGPIRGGRESAVGAYRLNDPDYGDTNPPPPDIELPDEDDEPEPEPDFVCDPPVPWEDCGLAFGRWTARYGSGPVWNILDFGPERSFDDIAPTTDGLEIDPDGFTDCDLDLLAAIWGLLGANLDLVEWAMCMGGATQEHVDCIRRTLLDDSRLRVFFHATTGDGRVVMSGSAGGFVIRIFAQNGLWESAATYYCHCADATERLCGLVSMASKFLHELMHVCEMPPHRTSAIRWCEQIYVVQSAFTWAIVQRYPQALESQCCEFDLGALPGLGGSVGQLFVGCECRRSIFHDVVFQGV